MRASCSHVLSQASFPQDIPTYPTPEVLKSQCGTCVTGNSKVCVRWHYFTDVSNPRGLLRLSLFVLFQSLCSEYGLLEPFEFAELGRCLNYQVKSETYGLLFSGKTVNVTWGCARATQLGCWRERTDLTTKEVCLCNYDDCNSTFVYRSSTAVAFICALLSTFMRKLGIS